MIGESRNLQHSSQKLTMQSTPLHSTLPTENCPSHNASGEPFQLRVANGENFSTHQIGRIQHTFHRHPLMRLDALAALAKRLYPSKQCRFTRGVATPSSPFDHEDSDALGRSIDEVFDHIEDPRSWVALYNVETDPLYGAFLGEVANAVRPLVERHEPGMTNVGGFIFISAPPAVTPFHIDRENNFWLQIRGRKLMSVWDHRDRVSVSAADRETFIVHDDNVPYRQACEGRSHDFDVGPGDGVYFPSTSPHMTRSDRSWTKPGDGVSISIGVVFYTDYTRRLAYVNAWNQFLRRRGLEPKDPGESDWQDRIKEVFGRALIWHGVRFHNFKPRVGF